MAPEYFSALKNGEDKKPLNFEKIDIFSLGVILL